MFKFITRVLVAGTFLGVAATEINSPDRKDKRRLAKENKHNKAVLDSYHMLRSQALTCNYCGGLAIATGQNGKMRKCIRCSRQFSSGRYNLDNIRVSYQHGNRYIKNRKMNMNYYHDAVKLLKEDDDGMHTNMPRRPRTPW